MKPESAVDMVYPLQDSAFAGSMASWVGQYKKATASIEFTVSGVRDGKPLELRQSGALPERSLEHPQLPRLWARARVDALLEKIEREGEDAKTIEEIIALARKYKFVTPYSSFLAVPRALLRPRVIRPGDPILRVHTDESITSVVSIFPFGLTKAAETSGFGRRMADAFSRARRHAGRHILGTACTSRPPWTHLSRVKDIRHREQAAGREHSA